MMKHSTKGMLLVLAILLSLAVVQTSLAEGVYEVTGTIEDISTRPNIVSIIDDDKNLIDVYGVPFTMLKNQYDITLKDGAEVTFEVYEYICQSGELRLKAISISINDGQDIVFRTAP